MAVATHVSAPDPQANRTDFRRYREALMLVPRFGFAAAVAAAAILLCHAIGFRPGYRPWPTAPGTAPMTAATLLVLGLSLAAHRPLRTTRLEALFAGVTLVLAILRLAEITFGFSVLPGTSVQPDPQAPPISFGWNSAFGAALCALTILSTRHVRSAVRQLLAMLALTMPLISFVGYSYALTSFHGRSSVYTTLILFLLASATALAGARSGIVRVLLGPFIAGRFARIQLLGAFLVPYAVGSALIHGGAGHATTVIGLGVVTTTMFMAILMSTSLVALDRMDQRHRLTERAAYHDATHDHLTGLANRRLFIEIAQAALAHASRQGAPACLILVDIDHFKAINDGFGHAAGDRVLQRTATLIARTIRTGDLAARFGGEEFTIFLPDTSQEQARALAERLRTAMAAADFSEVLGPGHCVTLSAGVAPRTATGLDAMLQAADDALYRAKARGRDRIELAGATAD